MIRPVGEPTVLFAGGGTGGHLFPGLAVAEAVARRHAGSRLLLAMTERDARAPHGADCPLEVVALHSPRTPTSAAGLPAFGARLSTAVARAARVLREERPHAVVGLGGYGSVAPALAARLLRIPVLLLEQNVVPGKANRLLSRLGAVTAASFDGLREAGLRGPVVTTGNPLRGAVLRPRAAHAELGLEPGVPVVVVLGGSQGSNGLNERFVRALETVVRRAAAERPPTVRGPVLQVIHAVGTRDPVDRTHAVYRRLGIRACVREFFHEMGAVWGTADVALCRSGGTTLAELTALGLPSVLVPYPYHADQQQRRNALRLVQRGAATLLEEEAMTPDAVADHLVPLLCDAAVRARRAREARRLGRPDAADRVVDLLDDLTRGRMPAAAEEVLAR